VTELGHISQVSRHHLAVIDGCDGAGKSTLAQAVAACHGHAIVHATLTPEGKDLFAKYQAILARPGPLVLDRSFVSELVHGPLDRGHSRLTLTQATQLAAIVAQRGGILVHLTGQPDRIAARLLARDGHAPPLARVSALIAAYTGAFGKLAAHAPVITIDTTTDAA
jgi:thymidylate kinase